MPLKDHRAEIQAVTDIATMIQKISNEKAEQIRVAAEAKKRQEIAEVIQERTGVSWGAW